MTSTSSSDYQGGTLQLRRNFQQGWTLQGAYTFGKAMNDADIAVGTITGLGAVGYELALRAACQQLAGKPGPQLPN